MSSSTASPPGLWTGSDSSRRAAGDEPSANRHLAPRWGVEGPYRGFRRFRDELRLHGGARCGARLSLASNRGHARLGHSDATVPLAVVFAGHVSRSNGARRTGAGCFVISHRRSSSTSRSAEWTLAGREPAQARKCGWLRRAPTDVTRRVAASGSLSPLHRRAVGRRGERGWASRMGPGTARLVHRCRSASPPPPHRRCGGRVHSDRHRGRHRGHSPAAGVPAAPVVGPAALLVSEQLTARGWFVAVDHPFTGSRLHHGFLWKMRPDSPSWDRRCGLLGEHNIEVLRELGYAAAEIEELLRADVIGTTYG